MCAWETLGPRAIPLDKRVGVESESRATRNPRFDESSHQYSAQTRAHRPAPPAQVEPGPPKQRLRCIVSTQLAAFYARRGRVSSLAL